MTLIPELREDLRRAAVKTSRANRRWSRRGRLARLSAGRLGALAVLAVLATGGVATAGVLGVEALIGTDPAGALFRANPQIWNQYNDNHPAADGLIQSTVANIATLKIPRVGNVEFWVARTRNGGTCEAFKAPNGVWAGTERATNVRYNFGGIVPGCGGPGPDSTSGYGGGFRIQEDSFGPTPQSDPRHYVTDATDIYYGTVRVRGAVEVRDPTTGNTAPILNRDFFVIEHRYSAQALRITRSQGVRLQALNAAGTVLSTSWTIMRTYNYMLRHSRH